MNVNSNPIQRQNKLNQKRQNKPAFSSELPSKTMKEVTVAGDKLAEAVKHAVSERKAFGVPADASEEQLRAAKKAFTKAFVEAHKPSPNNKLYF